MATKSAVVIRAAGWVNVGALLAAPFLRDVHQGAASSALTCDELWSSVWAKKFS